MKVVDRYIGGVTLVLGVLCLFEAHRLWRGWAGPGTMPLIVGVIFVLLSLTFFVFPSSETERLQWPSKREALCIGVIGSSFSLYISIINLVGYTISTWLFLAIVARYISPSRSAIIFIWTFIWTGVLAVGSYIIFKRFMGAYFPTGFIGF